MTAHFVRLQNAHAERSDDRGAAMAEYGILIAFVALLVIVILAVFGETIRDSFTETNDTYMDNVRYEGLGNGSGGTTGG